jgi:cell division protein ZapA
LPESVKVEIYDQTYNIAGDLSPEYVQQLASYVDKKMREVARSTGAVDSVRAAVLAALAIADELHTLQQTSETGPDENREKLRENAERCLKLVERALQQSS